MAPRPGTRAAATALAAAVALGLAACSSGADEPTSPTSGAGSTEPPQSTTAVQPGEDWTLGLDSRPTLAAIDDDRVYLTSAGGTRFPPQVYLLDAATGRELEHQTATGQPYDLLIAPDGRLWVAGDRHVDQPGGGGINVHDPESLVVVEHADLPGQAYSLALVGDEIWVGSDNAVFVMDPATLDLVRTMPIGGPAFQLLGLPSGDDVLAVEGDRIELLRPDGSVAGSLEVEASGNIVATATPSAVFLRVPVDTDSTVLTVDPALSAPGTPVGVDPDSTGGGVIATTVGDVVIVDDRRDEVLCLPGGEPPAVSIPATDVAGVLGELADGRLLFAATSGVVVRGIAC